MPRELHPDLRDCLERANPYTEYRIEISEPDVGQVLRRPDQFLSAPSLVSMSPANSLSASAQGALILTPSDVPLVNFAGTQSFFDLNFDDASGSTRFKGLSWTMDKAFSQCTLMSFKAKIQRDSVWGPIMNDQKFELQIFRIMQIPGFKTKNVGAPNFSGTNVIRYEFFPQLNPAPVLKASDQVWASNVATLNFSQLINYRLTIRNIAGKAPTPDQTGDLPKILFAIRLVGKTKPPNGTFSWRTDTASTRTISNVGTFERSFWARASEDVEWTEQVFADVPNVIF